MIQTIDITNQDINHQATNESSSSSSSSTTPIYNEGLLADDVSEQQEQQQQPITTTTHTASSINNINQHQRGRSQTITQKNINTNHYVNDQAKLHHAIQKFDTVEHDEPLDSDSDSELESDHHIHSNRSTVTSISSLLSNDTNYDMLLARLGSPFSSGIAATSNAAGGLYAATTTTTQQPSYPTCVSTPQSSSSGPSSITSSTLSSSSSSSYAATTDQPEQDTDWEFWSQMISNVDQVIKTNKYYLHHIRQGIPESLRGTLWPILSRTKNTKSNSNNANGAPVIGTVLDDQGYLDLLNKDNIYEKAIARDLDLLFSDQKSIFMTKKPDRFKDALFHLLKAYANYEDFVGYSKGFTYIALPLLLHMPEEEAFCVFVELMNGTYQWKSLYAPPTDGLSRVLFQLDGLIMEHLPMLYHHFGTFGIHSNDYAKTWFTTLFISSLPSLDCVYSIYDILLAEGTDALYGFALALLMVNQDQLLALTEQDELLSYLLDSHMGDAYKDDVKKMVQDSMGFKIQKKRLVKLAKEHQQALLSSVSRKRSVSISTTSMSPATSSAVIITTTNDMEALRMARQQNKALMDNVKQRQAQLEQLSKQQRQSAKELVDAKMELARARQSNDVLRQQSFDLKKALDTLPGEVEDRLKEHIHSLATKNMGLVDRNSELEYRLSGMEGMLLDIKAKFAQSENERDELNQRLDELRELVN